MRGTQLARQWKIIRMLEAHRRGLSASDIAAELDEPVRTVYRDLEAIEDAGFPLYTERAERNSYWKLMEGFKTDFPLPLTTTELMSLHMSRDILRVFEGTVFQESIESLFEKVRASLPSETIRYLDNISAKIKVGFGPSKDYQAIRKIIADVSDATGKKKCLEILYKAASTGEATIRIVDPYQVWAMNGCFYLIGHCHLRDAVRTFAIDRIKELNQLDESFNSPKDFSLEEYLHTAFKVMRGDPQIVKIRFSPGAANVVRERIWHPTQEIREQDDGSLTITLEVPINYEIVSWILGFGSAAEVLEPATLIDRIEGELEESLSNYTSGGSVRTKVMGTKKNRASVS